ncbi:MAG: hypothetical protein J0H08_08780 [Rhizobiales bacterium]|nr:hypothetical protein [Hyphomicrobiales bacterium]
MARVSTRVEPLDRDLAVIVDEELSPAAQTRALAAFARETLLEAQTTNRQALGRVPPHHTFVDGVEGASVDRVRPEGTIVYEFELVGDVLMFIFAELERVSPVLTGRYRGSHTLFADGIEVPIAGNSQVIPPAKEYVFVSTLPYSRKIEGSSRGKGRKPLSRQAPRGVYEITAVKAKARFGNVASVRFSFRAPIGGAVMPYVPVGRGGRKTGPKPGKAQRSAANMERASRYPAIVVTLRGA